MRNTLFLLFLSFICSCNADKQFQEFNDEFTKVTAILPDWNLGNENSRTSITTGTYPTKPNPVWVTGDSIGIYPDAGGDQLSFRINEGGSKTCTFDGGGWAMKSSSYTAYSPFKRSFYFEEKDALPISMLGQTQNGNDNADHLGAYDIQIAKGEKPETGSLIFDFDRYVALARLEITAPKAAKWTSISLESDAFFTTEATMNLTLETPTITSVATSNTVTLNLENVSTTNDNLSIIAYMMLLPVNLTGKTLSVILTDNEGNTYSCNANVTNNKTDFAANAARWVNAVFEKKIPNNQIWYTSSDGNVVAPYSETGFGANIVSNVYENGKGIITFDDDITSIGNNAFCYRGSLKTITIPNSATVIGNYAFRDCISLINVIIPRNVVTIGNNSFYGCSSLSNIEIPDNVKAIGEYAFSDCSSLTNVTIPNGITAIEQNTFADCTSLLSIQIPNSVETIGLWAFDNCGKLFSVTIPASVTSIAKRAFYGCENLSSITVEQSNPIYDSRNNCNAIIETASNTLISGCKTTVIPNTVTAIGEYAFGNHKVSSITIPNSVTNIGKNAFSNSTLTSITIPSSVVTIEEAAFQFCRSLKTITITDGVKTIGANAFEGCRSMNFTSIIIPSSITSIGESAFRGCSYLSDIHVEATTPPTLGGYAFYDCSNDITFYVPSESIESYKSADNWRYLNINAEADSTPYLTFNADAAQSLKCLEL